MTGMTKKTELNLIKIKEELIKGKTYKDIGHILNMTKANISLLIKTYLPQFKKVNRKLKSKDKFIKQTDLEISQHERFVRKRQNVKHSNQQWNLKFLDIQWPTHCPILGLELDYFAPTRQENSISFDRTDSSKGYIKGNVKIVSWRANRIKNDGTEEEHRQIADYLKSQTNI